MEHILRCACGAWTMNTQHTCGSIAVTTRPLKYSSENKYGAYRREMKKEDWIKRGWL